MNLTCTISNKTFTVSDAEVALRQKLNAPLPTKLPQYIFQELCAFWWHFGLHERQCDGTGEKIISVFSDKCPYPVWKRNYWTKEANPPSTDYDFSKPFFAQGWELFQRSPIPHNMGANSENCEYTDDWWYGKNCYLCHSGFQSEDCHYGYRIINCKDCQYCVFSFDSELCTDLVYSFNCYNVIYALYSRQCRDSAFLFDCQNCSDCLYCWNLRNKQYCIANRQYSKEDYEQERQNFSLTSRKNFLMAKARFHDLITKQAWWRAQHLEKNDNSSGDYLENNRNVTNSYFTQSSQDLANHLRVFDTKDGVDGVSILIAELVVSSVNIQDHCYDIRFCNNMINCKSMEYCQHCLNCNNCFLSCGLVGKKNCILNKEYSPEEYAQLKNKIIEHATQLQEYGKFFPGYFAANPYEESLAHICWPLNREEQQKFGFRLNENEEKRSKDSFSPIAEIPDDASTAAEDIIEKKFWDEVIEKPFKITKWDLHFSRKMKVPLPFTQHLQRIKNNFRWIFFDGMLRETTCTKTGKKVMTSLPAEFDGRILSEEAYLKEVY